MTEELRAKYNADDLKALGAKGQAFKNADGEYSYPIADADDLDKAIHAVGRGGSDHDDIRKYIIGRAKALGLSNKVPTNWQSDGSIGEETPMRSAATRESVLRHVEFRAEASDGNSLEGYAAVFNEAALIDSPYEGTFRESMMPGSFTKTISERSPVMLFDHGRHPMIGNMPIATIRSLREDTRGLYVRAELADNWLVAPVRDAIRNKSVTGMSMRMTVMQDKWSVGNDRVAERSIQQVAVAELGPTPFPCYEGTTVSVRGREVFTALNDPEVRAELALIFASGTDIARSAAASEPGPRGQHPDEVLRRRARAALTLS